MVGGGGGVLEFHRSSYQWKKSIIADIARLREKKNQTQKKSEEREESSWYIKRTLICAQSPIFSYFLNLFYLTLTNFLNLRINIFLFLIPKIVIQIN